MSDSIFENERLVEIYDIFDGPRFDLEQYILIVNELKAEFAGYWVMPTAYLHSLSIWL